MQTFIALWQTRQNVDLVSFKCCCLQNMWLTDSIHACYAHNEMQLSKMEIALLSFKTLRPKERERDWGRERLRVERGAEEGRERKGREGEATREIKNNWGWIREWWKGRKTEVERENKMKWLWECEKGTLSRGKKRLKLPCERERERACVSERARESEWACTRERVFVKEMAWETECEEALDLLKNMEIWKFLGKF